MEQPVNGVFKIAPSAAGIIYDHYRSNLDRDYEELVRQTDRIDSADLTLDEILHPEKYPFVLLSMTITNHDPEEKSYWDHLVGLLRTRSMDEVMKDKEVRDRCWRVISANIAYERAVVSHTTMVDHVSVTDFRGLDPAPNGNRFLIYSLFPDCTVNVKIIYDKGQHGQHKGGA